MIMGMNLSQMKHLIALHETGSFSRAADLLHVSQPALSRSILSLEEELGLPLIDRIGKRNEFTAFGEMVVTKAMRIAFEADELKRSALLLRGGLSGRICIGLGAGPAALLVKPLLKRVAQEYPGLQIDLMQGTAQALLQQLHLKTIDALIVDSRVPVPSGECSVVQLPDMKAGFLCRRGHPLLAKGTVTFEELSRFPIASSRLSEEVGRILIERYGPEAQPDRLVRLRSDSLEALLDLVRYSDAVFLGTYAVAIEALRTNELQVPGLAPDLGASGRYGIFTLAGRTPPPALDIVQQMVLSEMKSISQQLADLFP